MTPKANAAKSKRWYHAKPENRAKVIARVKVWVQANRLKRRTYNRIWQRRNYREKCGIPLGAVGHTWNAEQRFHQRMVVWAHRYNPDTLRLLK